MVNHNAFQVIWTLKWHGEIVQISGGSNNREKQIVHFGWRKIIRKYLYTQGF